MLVVRARTHRLTDLDPMFLRIVPGGRSMRHEGGMTGAHGLAFECPKCRGTEQAHRVLAFFRDRCSIGRWEVGGQHFGNLSLRSALALGAPCGWRGQVEYGAVVTLL